MKIKKIITSSLLISLTTMSLTACSTNNTKEEVNKSNSNLILATTTSTQDSGLLDELLPQFTEETNIQVKTVAVGTGKAIKMGETGEADVLLVHDTKSEEKFVKDGFSKERHDVMYNDFIIVGPKNDPLKLKEIKGENKAQNALDKIYDNSTMFISRADDSGTDKKEKGIWNEIELTPKGDWYIEAGAGMGDVLKIASEKQGYTLTDRATFLAMKDKLDLDIVVEKDTDLKNQYGVMCVNSEKFDNINEKEAKIFEEWILDDETQQSIKNFKKEEYGQSLFIPNAK